MRGKKMEAQAAKAEIEKLQVEGSAVSCQTGDRLSPGYERP